MWDAIKAMAGSKKAIAALCGVVAGFAGRYGLDLDVEALAVIMAPIVAYILGQGWADAGKEAAKTGPK